MSGIKDRIDDALLLWTKGRTESAFPLALIAVDATARLRYPALKVGERFERFLRDAHRVRLNVEYRSECQPMEHILYKWMRCELVHEGSLPVDVRFVDEADQNRMSVRAGGAPEYTLKVGRGWFVHVVNSVKSAPENASLFATQ